MIMLMLILLDSKECDIDSPVTVQEGQMTNVVCQLNFTADDADMMAWHVSWHHGNQLLASTNQDTMAMVKQGLSFRATRDDAGEYLCEIASGNKPRFSATCLTTVTVRGE